MKTSTVLTHVRGLIRHSNEKYICFALDAMSCYEPASQSDCDRVKKIIHTRMQMPAFDRWVDRNRAWSGYYCDPYSNTDTSLDWWLVWKGHVKIDNMPSAAQMREYRIAWLNALIEEFKSKGD